MLKAAAQSAALCVFVLVFSFLGFLLYRTLFPPAQPIEQGKTEQPQQYNTEKDENRKSSESFWQRPTDDPVAFFTLWIAAFTALLVLVSAFQIGFLIRADDTAATSAQAAKQSADVAEKTLIAAHRPWVRPQVTKVDLIVITEKKISFGITLQLINTGKSPAYNVDYLHDSVALDYPRLWIRQDDTCKEAETFSAQMDEKRQRNFTIFPNEPSNMMPTFYFPIEADVDNFRVGAPNDPNPWIAPVFIGCVAYRWDGSPKYHHTMFSY